MATRSEKERQKQVQEKCQAILSQLLRDEDNKYCVDCDAKGPRWASWNLGIFLCIRCAGIHRNLGVHISKVKSVNLDTWTPEQVAYLQQMGNSRARAVYEANLPDNFRRPQTDSSLEAFVRSKYETKKYIAKEWVPPPVPKPQFEVEEEKKKPSDKKSRSKGVEIPVPGSIPPPKPSPPSNSSPLASYSSDKVSNSKHSPKPKPSVDLLGLDDPVSTAAPAASASNGDVFGSFLSAEDTKPVQPASASPSHDLAAVSASTAASKPAAPAGEEKNNLEENFFSQANLQQDAQKKQQMSKESILSLYGQSAPPQQPVYGVPGGMYVSQPTFATPNQPIQFPGIPPTGIPGAVPTTAPVGIVSNGVPPTGGLLNNLATAMPPAGLMGSASMVGTNPFFNSGMSGFTNMSPAIGLGQLPQQMSNLGIGPSHGFPQQPAPSWTTNQPAGHTLSTNLWQ